MSGATPFVGPDDPGLPAAVAFDNAEPPQIVSALAIDAFNRVDPVVSGRCTAVDPALLWSLAKVIAALVLACAPAAAEAKLARMAAYPHGLLANRTRRKLAALLPDKLGEDREHFAGALIDSAVAARHNPEHWNALITAKGAMS